MQSKFGGEYQKTEMPKWMSELHAKMVAKDSQTNVQLFVSKIICNRPAVSCYCICIFHLIILQIFEPYAGFWMRSLMTLAMTPEFGRGFHYFIRDICVLLLKWKGISVLHL